MQKTFKIDSEAQNKQVVEHILEHYPDGVVILMSAQLGVGKSTFVKSFVHHLHPATSTSSPTFSLMNEYANMPKIYHYDLYMDGFERASKLGVWQNLLEDGYHFIEWADERCEQFLLQNSIRYIWLKITQQNESRIYEVIDER